MSFPIDQARQAMSKIAAASAAAPAEPPYAIQPFPIPDDPALRRQQAATLQIHAMQRIAPLTAERAASLQAGLPAALALLKTAAGRPAAVAAIGDAVAAARVQRRDGARGDEELHRLAHFGHAMCEDAFGPLEQRNPLLIASLALASFMAGYTIAHQWRHQ